MGLSESFLSTQVGKISGFGLLHRICSKQQAKMMLVVANSFSRSVHTSDLCWKILYCHGCGWKDKT